MSGSKIMNLKENARQSEGFKINSQMQEDISVPLGGKCAVRLM